MATEEKEEAPENVEEEEVPSNTYIIRPNYQHKWVFDFYINFACIKGCCYSVI